MYSMAPGSRRRVHRGGPRPGHGRPFDGRRRWSVGPLRLQLLYLCLQIRESTPADLCLKLRHLRLELRNLAFVVRDTVLQIGDLAV